MEFTDLWYEKTLESFSSNGYRSFAGGPFGSNLKSCDYTENGIPVIQLSNITEDYLNFNSRLIFTSSKKADELKACNAYPNEIIIAKMMPAGRACISTNEYERYVLGSDAIRVSLDCNKANIIFIKSQINSPRIKQFISERTTGSTRQRIGIPELKNLPLFAPSINEQNKIGNLISKIDERIEAQNKIIEDLKRLRNELNDNFFNHLNEKIKFSELYKEASEGGTPDTSKEIYYKDGKIPFAKIENLYEKYLVKCQNYITDQGLKNSSAWLIPENSILLSNGATIGEATINKIKLATKQGILGIVLKEQYNVEFIYYLFKSKIFKQILRRITTKGTMDAAYLKDLNEQYVPICSKEKSIKHISLMSLIDKKIELNSNILNRFKIQKTYLLANLFI